MKCEGNKNSKICNQILENWNENREAESKSRPAVEFEVFHSRFCLFYRTSRFPVKTRKGILKS